jgi:vitamin B12 transporter
MRFIFLFTLSVFLQIAIQAQTKVSGTVKDTKGRPLRGASITVKDTYDGATADSAGNFSFITTEKGTMVIEITILSHRPFIQPTELKGEPIIINATLKEKPNEETAVTVTAGSFEASDKKRVTVLNSIDIVTTASANADITGALKTLPGTQSVGESEGLFVRGGTATESKIFIDGTQVNNFFYSSVPGIASRGRFNPFLFKGTVFSTGGYSALYGQALSSALVLESIDLPDQSSANIGVSVVGLSAGFQKLDKNKKYSWGVTANHTNLALAFKVVPQTPDYYKVPVFNEGDANFRIKTSKTGMLKYYGYFSTGKIGIRNPDIDTVGFKSAFQIDNLNTYHNLSYKEKLGEGWRLNAGISISTNIDKINGEFLNANNQKVSISTPSFYLNKNYGIKAKGTYLQTRVVLEKKLPGISTLRFGIENSNTNDQSEFTTYNGSKFSDTVKENLLAGFAETDIYITNDLAAKIGGRVEHSQVLSKANVAPRLAFAYKLSPKAQVSLAYGQFYQNPDRLFLPTPYNVGFSKATHYIAQYQKVTSDFTLRGELFYKKYDALYKTGNNGFGKTVAVNTNGSGFAKGLEFFWRDRKTIKNLDYWISYSYLDTKREFNNYPGLLEPSFATKHTASLVMKKFVLKWKTGFNASYTFATGRPYYNIVYNNVTARNDIQQQGRTINYNNLSFSLNYLPNIGKTNAKKFTVFVFSLSNILGNNQIFTYNFSNNGQNKVAVTPASRRFLFIGCFISLGVDRTNDAINNNL